MYIHLIVVLLLSQIYANFALVQLHYLLVLLLTCLSGIVYGIFLSFKTSHHIKPDLKLDELVIQSNNIFNFKFYSELVAYLNVYSKQSNRAQSESLKQHNSTNEKLIDDKTSHTYSDLEDEFAYESDSLYQHQLQQDRKSVV